MQVGHISEGQALDKSWEEDYEQQINTIQGDKSSITRTSAFFSYFRRIQEGFTAEPPRHDSETNYQGNDSGPFNQAVEMIAPFLQASR